MSLIRFIFSKKFLKHLLLSVILIVLLIVGVFFSLGVYTHHGESYATPDFKGLTEKQFYHLIKHNKLRYKIIDSLHIDEIAPGVVIEQIPKAGSLIKENRTIFFTINAFTIEKVYVPDVIDESLRDAELIFKSHGLRLGQLIYIPSTYKDLVLGQQIDGKPIEAGNKIPKGTAIDLLVGQGLSKETTSIPNLLGLSLDSAKSVCFLKSLNIETAIYDTTIVNFEDSLKAFIWKQNPVPLNDLKIQLGSILNVWLTLDSVKLQEADTFKIQEPDSLGLRIDTLNTDAKNKKEVLFE